MLNTGLEKQRHGKQHFPTQSSQDTLKKKKKQLAFIIHLGNCDGHTQSEIFVSG